MCAHAHACVATHKSIFTFFPKTSSQKNLSTHYEVFIVNQTPYVFFCCLLSLQMKFLTISKNFQIDCHPWESEPL